MSRYLKRSVAVAVLVGTGIGILLMLGGQGAYSLTSSDEFCSTSCHSMQAYVANDPHFLSSMSTIFMWS
jgi:nitrate/TMAO reductase-like tetraheme cytochrome c subunit